MVVGFTYFYTMVIFQQQKIPENLQRQGAFIPGVRPGRNTAIYLQRVLTRITLIGALFLGIVAILPFIASQITGVQTLLLERDVAADRRRRRDRHDAPARSAADDAQLRRVHPVAGAGSPLPTACGQRRRFQISNTVGLHARHSDGRAGRRQRNAGRSDRPAVSGSRTSRPASSFARRSPAGRSSGELAKGFLDRGELVPDDVTLGIVDDKLDEIAARNERSRRRALRRLSAHRRAGRRARRDCSSSADERIDGVVEIAVPRDDAGAAACPGGGSARTAARPTTSSSIRRSRTVSATAAAASLIQRADDTPRRSNGGWTSISSRRRRCSTITSERGLLTPSRWGPADRSGHAENRRRRSSGAAVDAGSRSGDMAVTIKNEREIERMREAGARRQRSSTQRIAGGDCARRDDRRIWTTSRATRFAEIGATSLVSRSPRFPRPHLRLGQRRDRARHPRQAGAARRRHHLGRRRRASSTATAAIPPGPTPSAAISPKPQRSCCEMTEASLYDGDRAARAGNRLGAIGHAIERVRAGAGLRHGAGVRRSRDRPADVGRTACPEPRRSEQGRRCCGRG